MHTVKDKRTRRGATLVLVAMLLTVLMGFAALAIDFSRMYTFKAQIKTLVDAAALTGVYEKKIGRTLSDAQTQAIALIASNRVDGTHTATMAASDITPGTWNYTNRTFVARDWNDSLTNAVRATAQYTASWTLARMFGASTRQLQETSIAALGSLGTTECMKPFAIPYSSLLARAGYTTPYDLSHQLTAGDLTRITGIGAEITLLNNDSPEANLPGAFGLLTFTGNSAQAPADAINGCLSDGLGVGSNLQGAPGNKWSNSHTRAALQALCGGIGACAAGRPPLLVPIFDTASGNGNNVTYHVKYVGAFVLTRWDGADNLYGYLTTTVGTPAGGFSPAPGPVTTSVLVF